MSGRTGQHSRISPSPGKGAKAAYTLCPMNDPDIITGSNVLSIPLSAITLPTKSHGSYLKCLILIYICHLAIEQLNSHRLFYAKRERESISYI